MPPLNLYARVRFFYPLHTRPRVQRASGIPCALVFRGAEVFGNLGRVVPRECEGVFGDPPSLHAPLRVAGRGWGWGVDQLAPRAASLLRRPPPPTPPHRFAGGGEKMSLIAQPVLAIADGSPPFQTARNKKRENAG